MRKALVILCIALQGCATIAEHPIIPAGCQAADALTTVWGVHAGLTEANGLLNGMPVAGVFAFKALLAVGIYLFFKERKEYNEAHKQPPTDIEKVTAVGLTAMGCGAAIRNVMLINGLP